MMEVAPSPGIWWSIANRYAINDDAARLAAEIWLAIASERQACAKIAKDRAAVCQAAYDAGDKSEVHPLNEALHICQLILARNP